MIIHPHRDRIMSISFCLAYRHLSAAWSARASHPDRRCPRCCRRHCDRSAIPLRRCCRSCCPCRRCRPPPSRPARAFPRRTSHHGGGHCDGDGGGGAPAQRPYCDALQPLPPRNFGTYLPPPQPRPDDAPPHGDRRHSCWCRSHLSHRHRLHLHPHCHRHCCTPAPFHRTIRSRMWLRRRRLRRRTGKLLRRMTRRMCCCWRWCCCCCCSVAAAAAVVAAAVAAVAAAAAADCCWWSWSWN